ncbi:MAG: NfeD family protein [Alistipes sp.]|nr:NfeD family protein [Alistipes sp.]MBQ8774255.1 NfeD family protein [Alistipes sp.]
MEVWHIWIIVALVLVIIEIFTSGFAVICLAVGAVGGSIAAACDCSFKIQLLAFAIASFIALLLVRPLLLRFFPKEEKVKTNANAMVGRRGVVCNAIEGVEGGRVMIDGVDWKARSVDGEDIAQGEKVEIVEIDSIVLIVKKL